MTVSTPAPLVLTPRQLNEHLTQIVSETCGCTGAWPQHPGPMTQGEIDEIEDRVSELLARCVPEKP